MQSNPIKTKEEYSQALERLEVIFDSKKGTSEGKELEILGRLIEEYENVHFPINFPEKNRFK
ncbi:MAG: transcriptional regulator [Bacteroidetes bacterium]|nr:transcriptional regulator [Bacteroidota bacterium]